ncbi:SDR family NAD(P)-dependent oxidoreductase [Kineococcus glutinatus]|uniref:NADP-dependent 3-hydroxy acid dehydrogenase YdfG n=1 Tax=Kineococcus glutinatus TaxID=1070872 RepID=A0ABP9I074_9ACTN
MSEPVPSPRPRTDRPTALVTGATAGLGARYAAQLAERGHDLVLVARDEERLARSAVELRSRYGVEVEVLPADLSERASLQRVADRVADAARPVDVLVNNAGFGLKQRFADGDLVAHEQMFDVLCRAVMVLSRAAAGAMAARGRGRIVNIASVAGFVAGGGHYSAAKAYVALLTETLHQELSGTGVTATAVAPGFVRTEFHARAGMKSGGTDSPAWLDADEVVRVSLDDAFAGKVLSVPTKRYKALMGVLDVVPRALVRTVWGKATWGAARRHPSGPGQHTLGNTPEQ